MIENSKVMIRIDYVSDGLKRAFHGEIDENKLDELRIEYKLGENKLNEFSSEEENFIYLTNDGQGEWIDKKAISRFSELETKSTVYERNGTGALNLSAKKELRIAS